MLVATTKRWKVSAVGISPFRGMGWFSLVLVLGLVAGLSLIASAETVPEVPLSMAILPGAIRVVEREPGEAFLCISTHTRPLRWQRPACFGFERLLNGTGVVVGSGLLRARGSMREAPSHPLEFYGEVLNASLPTALNVWISHEERDLILEEMRAWNRQARELTVARAFDLIASIAQRLGWRRPPLAGATPETYVPQLRDLNPPRGPNPLLGVWQIWHEGIAEPSRLEAFAEGETTRWRIEQIGAMNGSRWNGRASGVATNTSGVWIDLEGQYEASSAPRWVGERLHYRLTKTTDGFTGGGVGPKISSWGSGIRFSIESMRPFSETPMETLVRRRAEQLYAQQQALEKIRMRQEAAAVVHERKRQATVEMRAQETRYRPLIEQRQRELLDAVRRIEAYLAVQHIQVTHQTGRFWHAWDESGYRAEVYIRDGWSLMPLPIIQEFDVRHGPHGPLRGGRFELHLRVVGVGSVTLDLQAYPRRALASRLAAEVGRPVRILGIREDPLADVIVFADYYSGSPCSRSGDVLAESTIEEPLPIETLVAAVADRLSRACR